jgi:beta-lactamase superfamily II metal-dependent hydrolase
MIMAVKKKRKTKQRPAAKAKKKRTTRKKSSAKPTLRKSSQASGSATSGATATIAGSAKGLRVRMFRVGFGDFFLVTVPTSGGDKFILIDCGVHYKDAGSIKDAVAQMQKDCDSQLALLIMTHRHADHISGFGTCADVFKEFTVERVWMSWFEDQTDGTAKAFQASLTAVAGRMGQALALRTAATEDDETRQLQAMAENITGGMAATGRPTGNQAALDVLHGGFKNTPEYDYYRAGDIPTLPPDLVAAGLTADILGPPGDLQLVKVMTNKTQQYLSAAGQLAETGAPVPPFPKAFIADASDYPSSAFKYYAPQRIAALIDDVQPDALAAAARAADKTLNNQSLIVHFGFGGKNLLFVGDAQWGNWENFLYGGAYGPGRTALVEQANTILSQLDFYKVGHHGSANATPKDAVTAMRDGCVGMCSTEEHAYNEVPRGPLLAALSQKMKGQLARSDQVPAGNEKAASDAGDVPSQFTDPTGALFIDYAF